MIAANPELLERDLIKNHSIVLGFIDALRRRGVEAVSAELSARVGAQVIHTAYLRWLDAGKQVGITSISKQLMLVLASIVPTKATAPALLQKKKVPVQTTSRPKSKSSPSQR